MTYNPLNAESGDSTKEYLHEVEGFISTNDNHNFWRRTLGNRWKYTLPIGLFIVLLTGLTPSLIYWNYIEISKPKLAEEWFKNILSLSVIFLIINYLNFKINLSRSKDKILVYIELTHAYVKDFLSAYKSRNFDERLADLRVIERFLLKIQSEEEFIYIMNHFKEYDDFSIIIERLNNLSDSDKQNEIFEFEQQLKVILIKLFNYHGYIQKS